MKYLLKCYLQVANYGVILSPLLKLSRPVYNLRSAFGLSAQDISSENQVWCSKLPVLFLQGAHLSIGSLRIDCICLQAGTVNIILIMLCPSSVTAALIILFTNLKNIAFPVSLGK